MNLERRKPQIFTKKTGPAVNCHFLVLVSAWPLRVQCTQNYNIITQAGAHSEDSHLGRCTPGAGRDKGHSEAKVTCICIFSRGGLKYNFSEDCIMDYCLRKLCSRTGENLSFPKRAFFFFSPPQGLREMGGKRMRLLVFSETDLRCCSDNV